MTDRDELESKPRVMALDSNNFMMRANYAYKDLFVGEQPSGMVYGYVNFLRRYAAKYRPDYCVPLFDLGRSRYRSNLDEAYKENRRAKDEFTLVQMRACRELASLLGFEPYMEQNVEADDLAAKVVRDCAEGRFIMLVSADHDWTQLVREHCVVHVRPGTRGAPDEIRTHDKWQKENGIAPERWPEVAAIMGDGGDNVIGIKGYGWKKSLKLVLKHGNLWTALREEPVLAEHAEQVTRNWKLTVLDGTVPTVEVPLEANRFADVRRRTYENADALMDFCDRWALRSLASAIEDHEVWGDDGD